MTTPETEDISLYSLKPFNHVKVYRVDGQTDFDRALDFGNAYDLVYKNESPTENALIFITRESVKPRWTPLQVFFKVEYDLFVVYFDEPTKLLFVNSSRRNEAIYEKIAETFTCGNHKRLPLSQINRVLLDLTDHDFFSIGMKNRMQNNNAESYRIISGASTQNAVDSGTARLFHQGHLFGKAKSNQGPVTIGYSSASKVWSNKNTQIPELVDWCKMLAAKLTAQRTVTTNSPVDMLSVGKEVDSIPEGVIAAGWDERAFKEPPIVWFSRPGGAERISDQLLNVELGVKVGNTANEIEFSLSGAEFRWEGSFSLSSDKYFTAKNGHQPIITVEVGENEWPLEDYLNYYPLVFYFADFSTLRESVHVTYPDAIQAFAPEHIEAVDWTALNVDITRECEILPGGKQSIHEFLRGRLIAENGQVVVYDHGTGEMADFVVVQDSIQEITFSFYHCKGSGGSDAGDRVDDVYEVCGQVVKSTIWLSSLNTLKDKLLNRIQSGSQIIKGDSSALNALFEVAKLKTVRFSLLLVQPGISKADLSEKLGTVLGAADQFVKNNKAERVRVLGSA